MMWGLVAAAGVLGAGLTGWGLWRERRPAAFAKTPDKPVLTAAAVAGLQQELEAGYRQQIQATTTGFAQDLSATSKKLSEQVERLTTEVISTELEEYQKAMNEVRGVAAKAAEQISAAMQEQQAGLQQAVEQAVAAERDRRLELIDQRLADIISGYLVETLGSGVDLGAQADYIVQALESRKDDIKKDLASGV